MILSRTYTGRDKIETVPTQSSARYHAFRLALGAVIFALLPLQREAAAAPPGISTAALGSVRALGIADPAQVVYVATDQGLFRSADPTYATWTRQNDDAHIWGLSPNPRQPQDLLITDGAPTHVYRSTDGGRTV